MLLLFIKKKVSYTNEVRKERATTINNCKSNNQRKKRRNRKKNYYFNIGKSGIKILHKKLVLLIDALAVHTLYLLLLHKFCAVCIANLFIPIIYLHNLKNIKDKTQGKRSLRFSINSSVRSKRGKGEGHN